MPSDELWESAEIIDAYTRRQDNRGQPTQACQPEVETGNPAPFHGRERWRRVRPEQPCPKAAAVAGRRTGEHPANRAPLGARLPAGAT